MEKDEHQNKHSIVNKWLPTTHYCISHPIKTPSCGAIDTATDQIHNDIQQVDELRRAGYNTKCVQEVNSQNGNNKIKPRRWNKKQTLDVKSGKQFCRKCDSFEWEPMDIKRRTHERASSVPPDNRVQHTQTFKDHLKARKQAGELYKSKDDLHKTKLLCFPIRCCTGPKTVFHPKDCLNDHLFERNEDKIPNVVPYMDRMPEYRYQPECREPDISPQGTEEHDHLIPDVVTSTKVSHRPSRPVSCKGSVCDSPVAPATCMPHWDLPCPIHTSLQNCLQTDPHSKHLHSPHYYKQPADTVSNAGTTYTFYNIDYSPHDKTTSDLHTMMSHFSKASTIGSVQSRYNSHSRLAFGALGKCVLRFGRKDHPTQKLPGHFSCPKRVGNMKNGDFVVLDTENQTLQLFNTNGMCYKVYQFQNNVIDIKVWDQHSIALLYKDHVGLFNVSEFQVTEVPLEYATSPRVLEKMKNKVINVKHFVVGMFTEVVIYDIQGKVLNTIGKCQSDEEPTFKRINALCVDVKNNDILVLDGELHMVFRFSSNGDPKSVLDTTSLDLGMLSNPLSMCINAKGDLLIADTFNHRILHVSRHSVRCIQQYSLDYYPYDLTLTRDGFLAVAINSEGRTFSGVRVYDYRNIKNF